MSDLARRNGYGRLLAAILWGTALLQGAGALAAPAVLSADAAPAAADKPQTPQAPQATNSVDQSQLHARSSPDWLRDGVIYEIFPRDFSAEGTLAGVTAQLDRLQHLGINILWLMPIHPIGTLKRKGTLGSPYSVEDYRAINADYGTDADLRTLISEAHKRGLRVLIDIVANHTSWDSVMIAEPDFYRHDAGGRIVPPQPDWEDVAQLNYDNPRLRRAMIEMLSYWIRDFDLDGFRCDAAALLPTEFWEQARAALMRVKPDIALLAEADHPDLLLRAFDVDYAWSSYHSLVAVIEGRRPAVVLRQNWLESRRRYPAGALRMRFSDDHDERRAIARFGEHAALAASLLMFTLDGVPMLYNGMEVGDTAESAAPALFEKLPIYWDNARLRPEFPRFYEQVIALRKQHSALRRGDLVWLDNSDPSRVLTYLRRDGEETVLVAINLSSRPFLGRVAGSFTRLREITPLAESNEGGGADAREDAKEAAARRDTQLPMLSLAAWQYRVYAK